MSCSTESLPKQTGSKRWFFSSELYLSHPKTINQTPCGVFASLHVGYTSACICVSTCVWFVFARSQVVKGSRRIERELFQYLCITIGSLITYFLKNRKEIYRKRLSLNCSNNIVKCLYWTFFFSEKCFTIKYKLLTSTKVQHGLRTSLTRPGYIFGFINISVIKSEISQLCDSPWRN